MISMEKSQGLFAMAYVQYEFQTHWLMLEHSV